MHAVDLARIDGAIEFLQATDTAALLDAILPELESEDRRRRGLLRARQRPCWSFRRRSTISATRSPRAV